MKVHLLKELCGDFPSCGHYSEETGEIYCHEANVANTLAAEFERRRTMIQDFIDDDSCDYQKYDPKLFLRIP